MNYFHLLLVLHLLHMVVQVAESQFAYPVDPNPPQIETTVSCFACEGTGCDVDREQDTHDEESCTGPRVACWILKNMETRMYKRTCIQPPSIRQGVFCNRHMEGKEFCYASVTARGRERLCGKCCLDNRCNIGKIQGIPDSNLQSCIACQGDRDEVCNAELPLSAENSTYVEQCLLPNSDCWTQRRQRAGGIVYSRGCQLRTCDSNNVEEICSTQSGVETCEKCCVGKLCNRFSNSSPLVTPYGWTILVLLLTTRLISM